MKVDSVHAVIERKLQGKKMYLPSDLIRFTEEAGVKSIYRRSWS